MSPISRIAPLFSDRALVYGLVGCIAILIPTITHATDICEKVLDGLRPGVTGGYLEIDRQTFRNILNKNSQLLQLTMANGGYEVWSIDGQQDGGFSYNSYFEGALGGFFRNA